MEGVGVMKDEELQFEEIETSLTRGGTGDTTLRHTHLNTSVSRTSGNYVSSGCDNRYTCVP